MMHRVFERARQARVVAAVLAVTGVVGVGAASADASPAAFPTCAVGYLCIQELGGPVVMVQGGQAEDFSPPVTSQSITNLTGEGYCVVADASVGLPNGFTDTTVRTVYAVSPGVVCPV